MFANEKKKKEVQKTIDLPEGWCFKRSFSTAITPLHVCPDLRHRRQLRLNPWRARWWPWWVTFHIVPDEVNTWKANALARKCTRGRSILYLSPVVKSNCAHPPVWNNTIGPSFFGFAFTNPDDQLFLDWMGYAPSGPCPQNNPSVVFYCLFFCYFAQFPLPLPLPGRFAGHWKWKQSVSHNTVVTSHSYQILTCELI